MEMNNKKRRQSMFLYVIIAMAILLAIQQSFMTFQRNSIQNVSYSEFLNMVEQGKVKEVQLNTGTGKIRFTDGVQ